LNDKVFLQYGIIKLAPWYQAVGLKKSSNKEMKAKMITLLSRASPIYVESSTRPKTLK
jgi:hypothetical protein